MCPSMPSRETHPPDESPEREQRLATLLSQLLDAAPSHQLDYLTSICQRHPDLAIELRELWGAGIIANAAGSGQLSGDGPKDGSATSSLLLPHRFGDYELLKELGRGGMGVVYLARQISLNREVAVKMIVRGQFASDEDRRRFKIESQSAAQLDHPNIVPIYEVGECDGQPFFSMKYIRGRTLADRLREGPVLPRDIAEILAAVSRAIHAAHLRGVLHRDLKPSNILLDELGVPHITDFGLAKQITDADGVTRTDAVIGTPAYMSPEQATGGRAQVGPASDVYSLGAILYFLLTSRTPFVGDSPMDVLLKVREQDVTPPRWVDPNVDRNLEFIALRCLQKPTDLRYQSAESLANDLDAYLHDEPIAAASGRFADVMSRLFRETHHAIVLENWGLLWMWHSLALLVLCGLTNAMHISGFQERWYYMALWTAGLGTWAGVFWALRRRVGPVTFVERQIAHVWGASMTAIGLLFFVEMMLELPVLTLSPILGLITGMVFFVKAGILSGAFYLQAIALFAAALAMARWPDYAHLIFGVTSAACFFFPGLKYYRQRRMSEKVMASPKCAG